MAAIFHLSSESDPLPAVTAVVWDKVLHLAEYGGLGLLLCRAFLGERLALVPAAVLAILVTSLYGASDEWHQLFVPERTSDVQDWLADSLGATVGAASFALLQRKVHLGQAETTE
jgi:VanZ family protein